MLPALQSLIALQALDTAADNHRRRLGEMPAAEQDIERGLTSARQAVSAGKERLQANLEARRALERDVAGVETRLHRFDDHKAAVKTNQEYQALLHEIEVAKAEKDALEERLLVLMEEADTISADVRTAEQQLAEAAKGADAARADLGKERERIEKDLERLAGERAGVASTLDARAAALYEQLRKARRGQAIARMNGEICDACHVRLRPHVTQKVRRNDAIVQCDSCQRILYAQPAEAAQAG